MNTNSELNIEDFHQLILNASSYMTKIEAFSTKIADSDIQSILRCLSIAQQILYDINSPVIKKLFVLRFVKDTMILASLSFYECVLIQIMPWILSVVKISEANQLEKRIQLMGKLLRGNNELMNSDSTICKTILQLVEEIIKWMGTNIKDHPYSALKFRSIFKLLLQKLPRIQNMKVTELTFFKADDANRYQAYFIQRDSGQVQGERICEYISLMISQVQKGENIQQLQGLVQTGDQYVITSIIQQLEAILEDANPTNINRKISVVEKIHQLMGIGQIEMSHLIKEYLLQKIVMMVLILQKNKEKDKNEKILNRIISMIKSWNKQCQNLLLPIESFKETFRIFDREGIQYKNNQQLHLIKNPRLGFTFDINKDKLNQIDCTQSSVIKRLKLCKYIPVYESIPNKSNQKQKANYSQSYQSSKNHSKISKQSNQSYKQKLFQDLPNPQKQINLINSQVNQIHLQHSNLSDRFHQLNLPSQAQKPLYLSFKKEQVKQKSQQYTPEVVFSDSFVSNQMRSPYKLFNQKDYIDATPQPSVDIKLIPLEKISASNKKNKQSNSKLHVSKALLKQDAYYNDYIISYKSEQSQDNLSHKFSKQGSKVKKQKSSSLVRSQKGFPRVSSGEKFMNPSSKLSNSKSINILQFNQAEYPTSQVCQPKNQPKGIPPPPVEQIRVEKTIQKPKFGFKFQEESIVTENPSNLSEQQKVSLTISKSESLLMESYEQDKKSLGSVPDNFMDLLKAKSQKIRVNGFENKVKQLQKKIQKMKTKKQVVANQVIQKQKIIQKLKQEMPLPFSQLEEQNQKLKLAMMQPSKLQRLIDPKQTPRYELKGTMKHISATPLKQYIKKQILYSKCRLFKGQYFQIGFQVKEKELALYLTFLAPLEQCSIKIQENSLKLSEQIDARIYKLGQGKQIKFKSRINNYKLFSGSYIMANLIIRPQTISKPLDFIQITLPYHLYNFIKFVPPKLNTKFEKASDWHYCCNALLDNPHYLTDFFPKGIAQGLFFSIAGELDNLYCQMKIIVDNDKFALQYEGKNEEFQLTAVRCVISLLQIYK